MAKVLIDEFRFLEKMNSSGVRYLLIGGFAVKFYGCRETAEDVDLLIDNSPENAQKLYPIILDSLGYQPNFQLDELSLERKQLKMPNSTVLKQFAI